MRLFFILLAVLGVATEAIAQVPPSAEPGRIEERFKPAVLPQAAPEINIPPQQALSPPEEAAKTRFVLKGVVVDGSTVYAQNALVSRFENAVGHEVSLLDVYDLRDAITAKYRRDGYFLSQAIIPPQNITGGIVHIQVVEGFISAVTMEGKLRDRRGLIAAMAEKVKRSRPARTADLERYVLLIGDIPGVDVSTIIKPSPDTPGGADLIVLIRHKRIGGALSADNRGSRAIGPGEYSAELDAYSLFGLDGQTSIQYATADQTRELTYVAVRHTDVLNSEGLRLLLEADISRSRTGGVLSILEPLGTGEIYRVQLSQPFIRSRSQSLSAGLGFTYLNSKTDLLGIPFTDDRVRYLTASVVYDFADVALGDRRPASTLIQAELDQGLDVLGATPNGSPTLSRAQGRNDFTKANFEFERIQTINAQYSLSTNVSGQISAGPLLVSQQFGLGGARYGRGYEPSELIGDQGVAMDLELRRAFGLGRNHPTIGQAYIFYDAGSVWLNRPLPGEQRESSLSSAGGGIRFFLGHSLNIQLELAKPLTRDIASRGNLSWRPLFAISTTY